MPCVNVPMVSIKLQLPDKKSPNKIQDGSTSLIRTMQTTETIAILLGESFQRPNLVFLVTAVKRNDENMLLTLTRSWT